MNLTRWTMRFLMLSCFVSILLGSAVVSLGQVATPSRIPNPVVYFTGQEPFQTSGKSYIRYNYAVFNSEAFPNTLFAAAPDLPPCGVNTRASRTWVDLYDQTGKETVWILRAWQQSGPWESMVRAGGRRNPSELYLHRVKRSANPNEVQIQSC